MKDKSDNKTIGVIGSGTMGSGIASACAISGYRTLIYDINADILNRSKASIEKEFARLKEKGKIDNARFNSALSNLEFTVGFDKLSECDIIIEAAIENIDLKKKLYKDLNDLCNPDTILATNTSSLSVTSISTAVVNNPARVVGMHFFNPANIMKLVEVVKGEFTSESVVKTVFEFCITLGKVPVMCRDTPAFIVNRVARAFYGESLKIMGEENIGPKLIDEIMKDEGGFAMGPFELMDLIGIDVNLSVTKSVYEAFFNDQKYKPSPIQQKMVDSGLLGRKTGQGFYRY